MYFFFSAVLSLFILPTDTVAPVVLPEIIIATSPKEYLHMEKQPAMVSSFSLEDMESKRIHEAKDFSLLTPNLYLPDYGSKMTSSIYIRGIGARMDQPALGLYVDNVPVMNKNNYDFDFFDIRQISILRGPQGTLYGRNAIGGVINVHTLSPFGYQGTRIAAEYGNANTIRYRMATYQLPQEDFGYSLAVNHAQSDGFFTNQYNDEKADRIRNDGLRFRVQKQWNNWQLDNIVSFNSVQQNGFAYSLYDEKTNYIHPINHNDPCLYNRMGISNGTTFQYRNNAFQFSSTTSLQYTDDQMTLDQDFLPKSMFTLTQAQTEKAVTQECILKSNPGNAWEWLSGAFAFYKTIAMDAPVTFKRNGIDELILANANKGIHYLYPDDDLLIEENEFVIQSRFKLPVAGASLFHQSAWNWNRWKFTAGLRLDMEYNAIQYHNSASFHYYFSPATANYTLLETTMDDTHHQTFYELTPCFSALYQAEQGNFYFTASRGYKTGGFNTQIFSDILQNQMMNELISLLDIGLTADNSLYGNTNQAIAYKPEYSWNYEIGSHSNWMDKRLQIHTALFYIDCYNQQLTIFPPGQSTGRLMSNAGKTRSFGAELSFVYTCNQWEWSGNYGYTNARFLSYRDGKTDYAGKYVPYAPQNTVSLNGEYRWNIKKPWIDDVVFRADWRGAGKIYWNESNTLSQAFYGQLGASISCKKDGYLFSIYGKNITNTVYQTFYFKSVGNSFVQQSKPLQIGLSVKIEI